MRLIQSIFSSKVTIMEYSDLIYHTHYERGMFVTFLMTNSKRSGDRNEEKRGRWLTAGIA